MDFKALSPYSADLRENSRDAKTGKAEQIADSEGHLPDLIRVKDTAVVRLRVRE